MTIDDISPRASDARGPTSPIEQRLSRADYDRLLSEALASGDLDEIEHLNAIAHLAE